MKEFHEELHRYRFVIWFLFIVFGILVIWGPQTVTLKPVGRLMFAMFCVALVCYYGSMYAMYKLMQNPKYAAKIRTEEILTRRYYSEKIYEEYERLKGLEEEDRQELRRLRKITEMN